jgi:hypothetical protein
MTPQVRVELLQLLSALCEDALTTEQHARLEELLESDGECRRQYLEYIDMHARLLQAPELCPAQPSPSGRRAPALAGGTALPAAGRARGRRGAWMRYGAVALATLAASLLLQLLWWHPQATVESDTKPAERPASPKTTFVATLTQADDCVWDHAKDKPHVGPRLAMGQLRLVKGVARIRFDSGPDLVLDGPVDVRLDSSNAATVLQGKVVYRADETAVPFDLHTPYSSVTDQGAEYAVAVGEEGEEIQVFEGQIQRQWLGKGAVETLGAGEARRYDPSPGPGKATAFDPTRFTRQLSSLGGALPDQTAGLLAYEGFEYPSADALRNGQANGGIGWDGPWLGGFARPPEGSNNVLALNPRDSLTRPRSGMRSIGGSFDYTGFSKYHRKLQSPLRLDTDGVYYLSFLFRREGPPADTLNAVAILFRTTEELQRDKDDAKKRLNIGVGGINQLFTHLGGVGSRTPLPLRDGETYLLIAKIVAGSTTQDQVFMRVYAADEKVEREEPAGWTVAGPPLESDLVFEWMEIHINSKTRQTLDEIRLGTTWHAVAGPWREEKR